MMHMRDSQLQLQARLQLFEQTEKHHRITPTGDS